MPSRISQRGAGNGGMSTGHVPLTLPPPFNPKANRVSRSHPEAKVRSTQDTQSVLNIEKKKKYIALSCTFLLIAFKYILHLIYDSHLPGFLEKNCLKVLK